MSQDRQEHVQDENDPEGIVNRYWGWGETRALRPEHGLPARNQRGPFTRHWWAGRWLRALARWIDGARLSRGRHYARAGQVTELRIEPGAILGQVQGTRPEPYGVRIEIAPFSDTEWQRAIEALAAHALYTAQLLNGEMSTDIDLLFAGVGLSLFPSSLAQNPENELSGKADFRATCSCPDPVKPCKHVAAVLLLAGEKVDDDPFLLFTLRGRTKDQVLDALRAQRTRFEIASDQDLGPHSPTQDTALAHRLADFWQIGPEAENVHIRVAPPDIKLEVLRILGDPGLSGNEPIIERLERVYEAVSQRALDIAFGERRSEEETES
ncbi:MAG: SWIM zinc finger family protein [Chloroflexi bacterium]|nr:SWIM zinc finger family protein [Chloroflexota bacterium]